VFSVKLNAVLTWKLPFLDTGHTLIDKKVTATDFLHSVQLLETNLSEKTLFVSQVPQKHRLKFDSHCIFLFNFREIFRKQQSPTNADAQKYCNLLRESPLLANAS
jgi:hypothetical protein